MTKIDINNADHPSRQKAIRILRFIDERCEIDLCGVLYYELEDFITKVIEEKKKGRKK